MPIVFGTDDQVHDVTLDSDNRIVSDQVITDDAATLRGIKGLFYDYVTGQTGYVPIAEGEQVTKNAEKEDGLVSAMMARAYTIVEEQPSLTDAQKYDVLHEVYGDNLAVVRGFAVNLSYSEAVNIWGAGRVDLATQNRADATEPTKTPADHIENGGQSQGTGNTPPPNPSPDKTPPSTGSDNGQQPPTSSSPKNDPKTGGDPVILCTGQIYLQVTDLEVRGLGLHFRLTRTYLNQVLYKGPLGYNWDHSYNLWLREAREILPDGGYTNVVYRSNGQLREDRYTQALDAPVDPWPSLDSYPDATFEGPRGFFDRLEKNSGKYTLELVDGSIIFYNDHFLAERIVDLNRNEMRLDYDSDLRLSVVTDPVGKQFTFHYDELNRLRKVRDEDGRREVLYTIGNNGDLEGVDLRPDGETAAETDYVYSGPDNPLELQHNLVRMINPLGHYVIENEYGEEPGTWTFNRVVRQRSEAGQFEYDYAPVLDASGFGVDAGVDPINYPWTSTTVGDARNHVVEHWFNFQGNVVRRSESLLVGAIEQRMISKYIYNADGILVDESHPDGSGVSYRYGREAFEDLHAGDGKGATPEERLAFGTLLRRVERPRTGFTELRRIVTEFAYTAFRRVAAQVGPYYADSLLLRLPGQTPPTLTYCYDVDGNLTSIEYPIVRLPTGGVQSIPAQVFGRASNGTIRDVSMGSVSTHYDYFADLKRSGFVRKRTEDANGVVRVTQFDVDILGRLTRETGPYGSLDEYSWNGFDLLTSSGRRDPGRSPVARAYSYNANRAPTSGAVEVRSDDDALLLDGPLQWSCRHDEFGRLIEESSGPLIDPKQRTTRFVLGPDGLVERVFDPRGTETRYIRDDLGRVVERISAVGKAEEARQRFRYTVAGEVSEVVDALGNATLYDRDAFGRVRQMRDADGSSWEYEYDSADRVTREIVRGLHPETGILLRWRETEHFYDEIGRYIRRVAHLFDPLAGGPDRLLTTIFAYDLLGRLSEVHDPSGAVWSYRFDGLNRQSSVTDPDGNETTWSYDESAHSIERLTKHVGTDANGAAVVRYTRSSATLDARMLADRVMDELGNVIQIRFDSRDLETRRIDSAGVVRMIGRNLFGEIERVIEDAEGQAVSTLYAYDPSGNRILLIDPDQNRIEWEFDPLNRVSVNRRGIRSRQFEYDREGRLLRSTDEQGGRLLRSYSPGGRLQTITPDSLSFVPPGDDLGYTVAPSGPSTFTYWPDGLLASAENDVAQLKFSYDSLGRLESEQTDSEVVVNVYDDAGRRSGLMYPSGRTVSFGYSAAGQLHRVDELASGASYPGAVVTAASRSLAVFRTIGGRVSSIALGATRAVASFDAGQRTVGVDWRVSGAPTSFRQERRLYGSRGEAQCIGVDDSFRWNDFDALRRQTSVEEHSGVPVINVDSLAPAKVPSALSGTGQLDEDELLPSRSSGTFVRRLDLDLDPSGNRRSVTELIGVTGPKTVTVYGPAPYDAYAAVAGAALRWDSCGSLIDTGSLRLRFDAYHRLREAGTVRFQYDPIGRLRKIDENGAVTTITRSGQDAIAWTGADSGQTVHARGRICHFATGGADYWPVSDLSGTLTGWLSESGSLFASRAYDAFGRVLEQIGSWPGSFGFRGAWRDKLSGLDLFPGRFYLPDLGRFVQRDPAGFVDGTNLYSYARNAPDVLADDWGLKSSEIDWWGAAWEATKGVGKGAAIGVGAGLVVGLGIVSAPIVGLALGGLALKSGIESFSRRYDESVQAGVTDAGAKSALAALGDTVGFGALQVYEGASGRDVVTDRSFNGAERTKLVGGGLGGLLSLPAGGFAGRLGYRAGRLGYRVGKQYVVLGEEASFVPSSAVSAESQLGWQAAATALTRLSPRELQLVEDVTNAPSVLTGRSVNVTGQGQFVLDNWLLNKDIQWTQRWQDVYNKALYLRTASGGSVNVLSGGGYTLGEVNAAESGARVSGIFNNPYWPF